MKTTALHLISINVPEQQKVNGNLLITLEKSSFPNRLTFQGREREREQEREGREVEQIYPSIFIKHQQ